MEIQVQFKGESDVKKYICERFETHYNDYWLIAKSGRILHLPMANIRCLAQEVQAEDMEVD